MTDFMKVLIFLFMVGLLTIAFVLLFGFSFLRMIFRAIFGTGTQTRKVSSNQQKKEQTNRESYSSVKKIFTREDGEYIDFEEIKD